jgi:3-deoxy-7-phosphoheptulonate synthase
LTHEGAPAVLTTAGNEHAHLVLRGGSRTGPNYDAAHVRESSALLRAAGAPPVVLVDCSHGNSGKDPARQPDVARDLASQISAGERAIIGVMLESHLLAGTQSVKQGMPLTYGRSITDACLSFDDTVPVLETLAQAVQQRRNMAPAPTF